MRGKKREQKENEIMQGKAASILGVSNWKPNYTLSSIVGVVKGPIDEEKRKGIMSLGGNCAYSDASGETSIFLPRYRHDDLVWVFNFLIVAALAPFFYCGYQAFLAYRTL